MIALVETVSGAFAVDLETGDVEPAPAFERCAEPAVRLPRLVAAAAAGATVVAAVDARPPLLVSYDAGTTWRESGRGLPGARAVAIATGDPDTIVYASRNRLYVSRNGGVFWSALAGELPEILALSIDG
ncbi:MAG TPA: hypothetical protein VKT18_01695 [Acidimicrobiales bacterium]|nr:hypothetical protein [Acidimicrobiales bacterium]